MTIRRVALAAALLAFSSLAHGQAEVPRAQVEIDHFATRSLELAFSTESAGAAAIRTYELHYTTDGGRTWQPHPERHSQPDAFPFTAPADGQYGFSIVAIDAAGNRSDVPQPGDRPAYSCVIDTVPPTLTVTRPTSMDVIYGGSDLVVDWQSSDAHLGNAPVTIEWRRSPREPWEAMTGRGPYRAVGTEQWFTPLASGSLEVRVTCRDLAGNTTRWVTPEPIEVLPFDGFRGSRAIAAEPYSQFRQLPMHYRVTGFTPIEVGEVQVWVRTGYGAWRKEIDLDRATPYVFEAPEDGVFFFYLRVLSKNRDADRPAPGPDTPADYRVIVDTHPPQGELFVGVGGGNQAFTAGDPIEVQWSVFDENLDPSAAKLEVSLDGGASWQLLSHRLKTTDGRGSFVWRPPLIGSESTRFRLELRDLADNRIHLHHRSPVRLLNPRVDPKRTALDHYQHAMILARMKSDDRVGDRAQLLRALEHLEVALLYDPNLAEAWHDRGVILRMVGRYPLALESFQKSHRIRPAEVPFAFSLVRAHLDMADQGLDPESVHVARASSTLAVVTKEAIYSYPPDEFRDLLTTYKLLQEDLKERELAP